MDLDPNTTQFNSPKRKRNPPSLSTIPPTPPSSSPPPSMLNTSIPLPTTPTNEEKQGSPRTKVAYNFQGLRLEDAGEIGRLDFSGQRAAPPLDAKEGEDRDEAVVRKRVKLLGNDKGEVEIPETPEVTRVKERGKEKKFAVVIGKERVSGGMDPVIGEVAKGVVLSNEVDPVIFKGSGGAVGKVKAVGSGLARAYPSINRLADSKSRAKKRAGTPPLGKGEGDEEMTVVDEERAALTWHDDEITGHDPDDPDDDGEGINGIGFKPTPAEAYARAQKRRAQMAEYRNREAREARKMRSERRRGSEVAKTTREEAETARRVRFMEAEAKSVIFTN